jgi:hypothetical protein
MVLENLFAVQPRSLMDMPKNDARLILAARYWVLLKSAREDPLPRLSAYLLSAKAAIRFGVLERDDINLHHLDGADFGRVQGMRREPCLCIVTLRSTFGL